MTAPSHEVFDQPALDARLVRSGPKLGAPAGEFGSGHARNLTINVFGECGTHVALRVDEPDQDRAATRVYLMSGVGPHPEGARFSPWLRPRATYQEWPVQRHEQLDTVVAVDLGLEAWSPNDHHMRPGCQALPSLNPHFGILASHSTARKSASSFKTRAMVAQYDGMTLRSA